MSIKIQWFDSDPYTGINIIDDFGRVQISRHVSFPYDFFEEYLKTQKEPKTVEQMNDLIDKYKEE